MGNKSIKQDVEQLLASQLTEWPTAAGNFEALKGVKTKEIDVDGMTVKVQFNPARIVSSGAKVDAKTIKERKCFLCAANRPDVQRGIEWGDHYVVLINPFPIFPRHFTIPDVSHTDQLINGRIADMMRLAEAMEGYTVFYNGPFCGASAPDHMHFQAGNTDFLTVAKAVHDLPGREPIEVDMRGSLSLVKGLPYPIFMINATDMDYGQQLFDKLYATLPVQEGHREPMLNLLCYAHNGSVTLLVIPRKRHRPSFYGTEGEGTMLISPASVDLGGVFITPLEKDFNAFNADTARRLYDELCLSHEEAQAIADQLK